MKQIKTLIFLEQLYSKEGVLNKFESLIKFIELKVLILPKIKKMQKAGANPKVITSDEKIISILKNSGFKNFNQLNYDVSHFRNNAKLSKKIIERLYDSEVSKQLNYKDMNYANLLKAENSCEIYRILRIASVYEFLIENENPTCIYIDNSLSLEGSLLKNISSYKNLDYYSFAPQILLQIKEIIKSHFKLDEYKYLTKIGLFKFIAKEGFVDSLGHNPIILVDATYINYLRNIIPVINDFLIPNGYEVFFLANENDLKILKINYQVIKRFKVHIDSKNLKKSVYGTLNFSNSLPPEIMMNWLEQIIEKEILQTISKKLPNLVTKMEISKKVIKNLKPDIILVGDDRSSTTRPGLIFAHEKKIPIIEIQHGIFPNPEKIVELMIPSISDKICIWGPSVQDILYKIGVKRSAIEITGNPLYDTSIKKSRKITRNTNSNEKILLFATSDIYKDINLEVSMIIGRYIKEIENISLFIKPHPAEPVSNYKFLENQFPNKIFVKDSNDNTTELIIQSDVVIMNDSTIGVEASILGKPILLLNLINKSSIYTESGVAVEVKDLSKLISQIDVILNDTKILQELETVREKFVYDYSYLNDGKASERVFKVIKKVLNR